ncbi:unnamed protein product [Cylindrotheca closterium]|uniref:Plant heme peroxidase family profile domain-containing protein n=1 Tax=Cylindrotheca closterium TaxID=2856 RepID=A0AAD2G5A8_9STRA|nr:unnamed protein product [Cylindrotheca closterium]
MRINLSSVALLALTGAIPGSQAGCPYMMSKESGPHQTHRASCPMSGAFVDQEQAHQLHNRRLAHDERVGDWGEPDEGYAVVKQDIADALTDSKDYWPADFGNYAGLMIRLAWHCAGSYRKSDGRGGCDGGRIRFSPELTWPDNGNLNFALQLLDPIKEKYGSKLSWGDLIILAGNVAIESTGGPILGFCGGRIDDPNGDNSLILGPNEMQEELTPCATIDQIGTCAYPLGPTVIGNIYVEPDGAHNFKGDAAESQKDVAEVFSRMGFNDTETVALVGGGHAWGKSHGPCMSPPCGEEGADLGIGINAFTSGFDGKWTVRPTEWTNDYFVNLFDEGLNWTLKEGPSGKLQFFPENGPDIMMLVTDMALAEGDYRAISELYRDDIAALEHDFKHAWYHLTSADMGPASRCYGSEVPPAQDFQYPLPDVPVGYGSIDFIPVRASIQDVIDADAVNIGHLANLAYRSANTFRATDYRGGANGARIRFSPEMDWEVNAGTADALALLEPVKAAYPDVSYADLIVLAGQAAIEAAGGSSMTFCAGRVDAIDGSGSKNLDPRTYAPSEVIGIRDNNNVRGLTPEEGVALFAMPGADGVLSNAFFTNLKAGEGTFTAEEEALLDPEFSSIVDMFVEDNAKFLEMFESAWNHLMIADRFDGPLTNACAGVATPTLAGDPTTAPVAPADPTAAPGDASPTASPEESGSFIVASSTALISSLVSAILLF